MDVTVNKQEFIFPIPQGSASTIFDIKGIKLLDHIWIKVFHLYNDSFKTETLNGSIIAVQNSFAQHLESHYVSTVEYIKSLK